MAKKRLNAETREILRRWMYKEKVNTDENDKELLGLFNKVVGLLNHVLRNYYPEDEMFVIRKHQLSKTSVCIKFIDAKLPSSVFAVDFGCYTFNGKYYELATKSIVDIPNIHKIHPEAPVLQELYSGFVKLYEKTEDHKDAKCKKYSGFINACKYLEDVEEVITLPEEIRLKITGKSTILTIVNPELINEIREDFKSE